ncbi:flagellar FlbD family protein [Robinsoniella peoriensis]|uniref:flagellar FlbD family protein n=1 Tax=Robinsoniella peoriensis TaxID=180332 RepID=UPI00085BDD3B|nr:flagellar FlbD family protein [Robinsoniella peoriensis]
MIELTKLRGEKFMLNCDLIEMVEENPDTTILLTNGRYLIVQESMREITDMVIRFRRKIYARSDGNKEFQ